MPDELFVPTVENPGRVSFSEDGTTWSCTRDEFIIHRDENGEERGVMQMLVTHFKPAGSPLPPQTIYTDRPIPPLPEKNRARIEPPPPKSTRPVLPRPADSGGGINLVERIGDQIGDLFITIGAVFWATLVLVLFAAVGWFILDLVRELT